MVIRCQICGRPFEAKRSTAKYCSGACRQRAHRGFAVPNDRAPSTTKPPTFSYNLTVNEVADVIQQAHRCANDLYRASTCTPAPVCLSLRRVAMTLAESLKDEGL